jgi:hypothetical protein
MYIIWKTYRYINGFGRFQREWPKIAVGFPVIVFYLGDATQIDVAFPANFRISSSVLRNFISARCVRMETLFVNYAVVVFLITVDSCRCAAPLMNENYFVHTCTRAGEG